MVVRQRLSVSKDSEFVRWSTACQCREGVNYVLVDRLSILNAGESCQTAFVLSKCSEFVRWSTDCRRRMLQVCGHSTLVNAEC